MKLEFFAKRLGKVITDNAPAILTAIGVAGTVTTAYLTGKATFKAAEIIAQKQRIHNLEEKSHEYELKEKVRFVWKEYLPPVGMGLITVVSIVAANRIGMQRAAAMAAAYSIATRDFSEYREKVAETIGKGKESKVRDEIAQDRVNNHPVGNQNVIMTGGGEVLCFDSYTGRYFMSSIEALKKAQNDLNYQLLNQGYASLTEFYRMIGLSKTTMSDEMGWNSDNLLELMFTTTMSDDDRPCIVLDFHVVPVRDYYKTH